MAFWEQVIAIVPERELSNIFFCVIIVETTNHREAASRIFHGISPAILRVLRECEHLVDVRSRVLAFCMDIFPSIFSLLEYQHARDSMIAEFVVIIQEPVELLEPALPGEIFKFLVRRESECIVFVKVQRSRKESVALRVCLLEFIVFLMSEEPLAEPVGSKIATGQLCFEPLRYEIQVDIQGLGCDGNILRIPAVIITLAVLSDVIVWEGRLVVAIA